MQRFIISYIENISTLAFAGSPFEGVTVQELIQQIESYRKAKNKLPTWFKTENLFYPPKLNLEQTSSEITAKYKASLIKGNSLADTTGGFGVDSFYFSDSVKYVHHYEQNECLSKIATHNFSVLKKENIQCFAKDGIEQAIKQAYDLIYIDPSRRNGRKGKVFFLKDCEPNVPENLDTLLKNCKQLLLKTSPMLDLSIGLAELKSVSEIHIVAVNNEVKELLWLLYDGFEGNPSVKTINFSKENTMKFNFNRNEKASTSFSLPKKYLYEPNAAIMKSGAFGLLSEKFKLNKLHKHTHLFTSDNLKAFPGRTFIVIQVIPYQKKEIKKLLKVKKANVAIRNFPESVAEIRKKLKISDGGTEYLFFITTENNEKKILVCSKV